MDEREQCLSFFSDDWSLQNVLAFEHIFYHFRPGETLSAELSAQPPVSPGIKERIFEHEHSESE